MRFFVTGSAGFIGFHLCKRLLADGHIVDGFDALTPYYDVELKKRRLALLARSNAFRNTVAMLEDISALQAAYEAAQPDIVIHLAGQAGVRYSLDNPRAYIESNIVGTFNLLECVRSAPPHHLLMASTSSVYGANRQVPFAETMQTDHPLSLYAATKKASEDIAHSYAHLWAIPITMFRFFTVYGPWGRPDMALFKFVEAIENNRPIDIYNNGDMKRDFTYVDDLVEGIVRLADRAPLAPAARTGVAYRSDSPQAPFRTVNIGNGAPVNLLDFVSAIEEALGRTAHKNFMPMQKGDVPATFASAQILFDLTGFRPATSVREGVAAFVDWYRQEYRA